MKLRDFRDQLAQYASTLIPSEYGKLLRISRPSPRLLLIQNTDSEEAEMILQKMKQRSISYSLSRMEELGKNKILDSFRYGTDDEDVEKFFKENLLFFLETEKAALANNLNAALTTPNSSVFQFLELAKEMKVVPEDLKLKPTRDQSLYPNPLHGVVLQFLLAYRQNHPRFTFWLRSRNNKNRLHLGFWFQGTENYAFVGLYNTWAGNKSTKGIGLVFWPLEDHRIGASFVIIFRNETRPEFLNFYAELIQELDEEYRSQLEKISDHEYRIVFERPFESVERFLSRFKPRFDSIIEQSGLSEIFISAEQFEKKLERVGEIQERIRTGDMSLFETDPRENFYPDIDDNEPQDVDDDDELSQIIDINSNSNVDLQLDSPALVDELGRKPFVDALYEYIRRLWNDKERKGAYTIHINGEWGSGKSTVLGLLKQRLESEKINDKPQWVVAEFNAWLNQHVEDPWWIFLDTVYRDILKSKPWYKKIFMVLNEWRWRIFSMNKTKWVVIAVFSVALIISFFTKYSFLKIDALFEKGNDDVLGIVISFTSFVATIGLAIYNIVNSLLPGSEEAAIKYRQNVRDPMKNIKKHFSTIIGSTSKNVTIFIDDIDRCDPRFVVRLLEGLQTLFRNGRVLYVIAGDASWIRESFEIHYDKLRKTITKPGQSLGNFFVEKTLQQSISLPPISEETKKAYWNKLIQGKNLVRDETKYTASISQINSAIGEKEMGEIIQSASTPEEKTILREKAAAKVSTKKILKDIEHQLLKYHALVEPNPRSMKRLVNNIALEKASNFLAGLNEVISEDTMIRWAILRSRFPLVAAEILRDPRKLTDYQDAITNPKTSEILEGIEVEAIQMLNA